MHKMNHLLVAVVSWYNFKLIWLDRFLVIKTIKLTIKLTPTGEVRKQGTQAVVTIHNILISNKVNLHYLLWMLHFLQKTNDITSVQNIFYYPYTSSPRVETGVLELMKPWRRKTGVCALVPYTKTLERKNDTSYPFICLIIVNIDGKESFTYTKQYIKKWEISSRARHVIKNCNCKTRRR